MNVKEYGETWDVVIAGGGISGTIAAIAAGRCGAKVLLIEQHGYLGGMLTCAGVGPMMTFHAGEKQIIQGIVQEIVDRLISCKKSVGHILDTIGFTYTVTPFDSEYMKIILEELVLESGCKILYHTFLADAELGEEKIESVLVANKSGLSKIRAKIFVDATGDGDLAYFAGAEYLYGDTNHKPQAMTLNLKMNQVNLKQVREYFLAHPEEFPNMRVGATLIDHAIRLSIGGFAGIFKDAVKRGDLTHNFGEILMFETANEGEVIINTTRIYADPLNPDELSDAEIEGRRQCRILSEFLIKSVPGFGNAQLLFTGPNIGVRSSRQIRGNYLLTGSDLIKEKVFPDTIAHGSFPIDIHDADSKENKPTFSRENAVFSIPFRCLITDKIPNLIIAGRCISATFEAQASIRVTPTVGAIGHAAGVAAGLAIAQGKLPGQLEYKNIQKTLLQQNAYLELQGVSYEPFTF